MPRYTKRAERDMAELPPAMQAKALSLASRLDNEPALGKKLLGKLNGKRSARLGRSHRIIYMLEADRVIVLTIATRRDSYR
jgi:mRNA-degrading endonuclease RelE of RelBE toxin-antitoxin system